MLDQATMTNRLRRARQLMAESGIDLLVVGPSADFQYFTGHLPGLSERLTALVIPRDGSPTVIVPRLEAPLLADLEGRFEFGVWDETERPTDRIAAIGQANGAATVAVNDQLWSAFLIGIQDALPGASYRRGTSVLAGLRSVKDAAELELLREASRRTDAAWEEFCATTTLTGQTERQVADRLSALLLSHGLDAVAFCAIGSGPNGASPHHHTGDRVVERGDPLVIDFGGTYQGYYSDITRTPVAGEADPEFVQIYEVVLEAQQAAFEAIRPGAACQDIDRAARRVISERGFGDYFVHRVGHGLGLTVHEEPYLVEGNQEPLRTGNVVSDEPGIYIPGRWGVRIEDLVVVTDDGAERYNTVSRELTILP